MLFFFNILLCSKPSIENNKYVKYIKCCDIQYSNIYHQRDLKHLLNQYK